MLIIWALLIYKGIPSGSESSLLSNIMLIQSWVLQDKMTHLIILYHGVYQLSLLLLFPALLVATKNLGRCLLLPVLIPIAVVAYSSSKGIDFFSSTGGTGVYSMLYTNPLSRVMSSLSEY
jgi:hypothetical protein